MCEYCDKKIRNKKIKDVDDDKLDWLEVIEQKKSFGHMLYVELDAVDSDGYKACDFFQINYCPMCRKEVNIVDIEKAKENLKRQLIDTKKANKCGLATKGEFKEDIEAIETVLNELEYKQAELEKKDKIIDEMAKELVEAHKWFYSEFDNFTKEDFIRYFTKKVEDK